MDKLLTIEQAADILQVSTRSVRRYISSGDLEATRIGDRLVRIKQTALEAFIDAASTERP